MRRGQIISYLKSCKMIAKGFLYHVVRFKDLECETLSIESVLLVREFPGVFHDDLPGVPPSRKFTLVLTCHWIRIPFQFFHIGWLHMN